MKNKFELGIEISENVSNTAVPREIRRYDNVPAEVSETKKCEKKELYRYRPGVNCFMTEDLDV